MEEPRIRRRSLFPKSLARSLEPVVKPIYKKHGFAEHRILTEWPTIVGDALAACSIPQKLVFGGQKKDGGTLHVLVASARALELQHMHPVILEKIATYFGYRAVGRLVFLQGPVPGAQKTAAAPENRRTEKPEIAGLLKECDDPEMHSALMALGSALSAVEN